MEVMSGLWDLLCGIMEKIPEDSGWLRPCGAAGIVVCLEKYIAKGKEAAL
jgi:hypothetical protein